MKISTILDHIDSGHIALPEFQRGYVWNRNQVRSLLDSLYKRHPIGGLLVWATDSRFASHRGDGDLPVGTIKLLLDGQQRITTLYGLSRAKPPKFFDGDARSFTGLSFHLETESFQFYQPIKMRDDPLWIDVSQLLKNGHDGLQTLVEEFAEHPDQMGKIGEYSKRVSRILGILDIELHTEEITGSDKTSDVVVDIFNRVNSGGTKLSKGDLAMAKICADWPEGRNSMQVELYEWNKAGYSFKLDWYLRSVNTVLTGEAKFEHLHDKSPEQVKNALNKATKHINTCLNLISGRLGLDHDRVLFGRLGVPVIARYLEQRDAEGMGAMSASESDKLLFWFVQAAMWGRFSGSAETNIDKDLEALEDNNLDSLLKELRLWRGGFKVEPHHFTGWSIGARFYPVLYMLTRVAGAKDWGNGLPLKAQLLGRSNRLEAHHIFPKSRLYGDNQFEFNKTQVTALANFCFLTKESNQVISNQYPEIYFNEVESAHPGSLASQWIPSDQNLWKIENYLDFLEARNQLLADELNRFMESLLHGDSQWFGDDLNSSVELTDSSGSVESDDDQALENLNAWVVENGLPSGDFTYDLSDFETGEQKAIFDLAWPDGLQENLSQPVAVLLDEDVLSVALASQAGFKCFTSIGEFENYIKREILIEE